MKAMCKDHRDLTNSEVETKEKGGKGIILKWENANQETNILVLRSTKFIFCDVTQDACTSDY